MLSDAVREAFGVRRTCVEMLRDRGFTWAGGVSGGEGDAADPLAGEPGGESQSFDDILRESIDRFAERYGSAPYSWSIRGLHSTRKVEGRTELVWVRTVADMDVRFFDDLDRELQTVPLPYHRLIIVICGSTGFPRAPKKQAQAKLDGLSKKRNVELEWFLSTELQVNISHHTLVPKHTPLTAIEKEKVLQQYKVTEAQLPIIERADPMARYFGLRPGDVVRIERPSETAGKYITYRICR